MLLMKKELGMVIATCRKQRLLKQDYMAYKLGITTHAYANIERGRSDICSEKLFALSNIFGLKMHQLILLAEEIIDVGKTEWLDDVVKGIIRISGTGYHHALTPEDKFLFAMTKAVVKPLSAIPD